jgi:hypothetical protein
VYWCGTGHCDGGGAGLRKAFFLKKEAKTFANWRARQIPRAPKPKSFLVLFFKKELLIS